MKRRNLASVFFAAAMLAWAASAGAVDGTIEINQAKVLAAGGFPYFISANGSYRLTGSLTVPAGEDAIDVNTINNITNVTIDLNGFLIIGPGGGGGLSTGISATVSDVTVENGTVTGFGTGVNVASFGIVRNVHADANGQGILTGPDSVIEGCTANLNALFGIVAGSNSRVQGCTTNNTTASANPNGTGIYCFGGGCAISGNTANGNGNDGIECAGNGCVISGNTADANSSNAGIYCDGIACLISGNTAFSNHYGIFANDGTTGYGGNVLKNTTDHSSGTSLDNNLCSGTVC